MEHFRISMPEFIHPGSMDCVQRVKAMALENWNAYKSDQTCVTNGQVLCYPLQIERDGSVKTLDGVKEFPDFPSGSYVMGKVSAMIPQKVTT